jgi:maltose-binding protein MalE
MGWQGSYLAEKQAIFDAYHKLHPKVTITLVHQDNVVDKSIAAINAGSGPDIIAWADDSLGKLAQSHIVVPLDDLYQQEFR